jgi:hypothetical protein
MNPDSSYAHLGNDISHNPEQLTSATSLIKDCSGESLSINHSKYCSNKFICDFSFYFPRL